MRTFLSEFTYVARQELLVLWRYPKMFAALLVVAVLPSVYAAIYLTSVWDPAARTQALPVAVVNLDEGVTYKEHVFNIGSQVVFKLGLNARFGYHQYDDTEQARLHVRQGKVAFALIIPKDFSSNAIPGAQPGGGKLVIYASEGNNYQTAALAKQFAAELGHEVNESLNERRWALVLATAAGSQRSVDELRAGVEHLRQGAQELSTGALQAANAGRSLSNGSVKLNAGVGQVTDGFKQLSNGLRTMDARRPPNSELNRLKTGAETLAAGHVELSKGLDELQGGSRKVLDGVMGFKTEADDSPLLPARVKEGVGQLAGGVNQLDDGIRSAAEGQKKLADGAARLSTGVGTLTNGMRTLTGAIRQAVTKLPEDSQLDDLASGSTQLSNGAGALAEGLQKLKAGSQALASGMDSLARSLPTSVDTPRAAQKDWPTPSNP